MEQREISEFEFHSEDGSIKPENESKDYSIEVVSEIIENSSYESDENKEQFEQVESDNSEEQMLVQEEDSVLEKFITKRSPKKFEMPEAHITGADPYRAGNAENRQAENMRLKVTTD